MNARLYDPITSRTLSPDNYVADADATQAYNRYSYCHNNPMKYTDPDGNSPILVAVALFGGALNMISNADKIAKDPWSAVGYFTSGAIGGMLSLTNPLAGGAFTTNMNIVTDIAFGNVPVISNTSDAVSYLGFKVLDGVGAAGTGQLVKGLFNFIGITSWSNTATLTGVAHLTEPGTSILKGVTGPTVGIEVAKKATVAPVWSSVANSSSQILGWGNNAKGHLIKHADALGFGGYSPQQLQKMLPQLRSAANQLYNDINPALTRIGRWTGQADDVIMQITNNGKMIVTKLNGEFVTIINKTSNNWYKLAKPL